MTPRLLERGICNTALTERHAQLRRISWRSSQSGCQSWRRTCFAAPGRRFDSNDRWTALDPAGVCSRTGGPSQEKLCDGPSAPSEGLRCCWTSAVLVLRKHEPRSSHQGTQKPSQTAMRTKCTHKTQFHPTEYCLSVIRQEAPSVCQTSAVRFACDRDCLRCNCATMPLMSL